MFCDGVGEKRKMCLCYSNDLACVLSSCHWFANLLDGNDLETIHRTSRNWERCEILGFFGCGVEDLELWVILSSRAIDFLRF